MVKEFFKVWEYLDLFCGNTKNPWNEIPEEYPKYIESVRNELIKRKCWQYGFCDFADFHGARPLGGGSYSYNKMCDISIGLLMPIEIISFVGHLCCIRNLRYQWREDGGSWLSELKCLDEKSMFAICIWVKLNAYEGIESSMFTYLTDRSDKEGNIVLQKPIKELSDDEREKVLNLLMECYEGEDDWMVDEVAEDCDVEGYVESFWGCDDVNQFFSSLYPTILRESLEKLLLGDVSLSAQGVFILMLACTCAGVSFYYDDAVGYCMKLPFYSDIDISCVGNFYDALSCFSLDQQEIIMQEFDANFCFRDGADLVVFFDDDEIETGEPVSISGQFSVKAAFFISNIDKIIERRNEDGLGTVC